MSSAMYVCQYSIDIHKRTYVPGMWIIPGEVPWNLSVTCAEICLEMYQSQRAELSNLYEKDYNNFELFFKHVDDTYRQLTRVHNVLLSTLSKSTVKHKHQWAMVLWITAGINTNMYVKTFHQTLNKGSVYKRQNQSLC